jgi:hypothetical protein
MNKHKIIAGLKIIIRNTPLQNPTNDFLPNLLGNHILYNVKSVEQASVLWVQDRFSNLSDIPDAMQAYSSRLYQY